MEIARVKQHTCKWLNTNLMSKVNLEVSCFMQLMEGCLHVHVTSHYYHNKKNQPF
jgi:hypothetical protein